MRYCTMDHNRPTDNDYQSWVEVFARSHEVPIEWDEWIESGG